MVGLSDQTVNYDQLAAVYDAIMGDPEGVEHYAEMLANYLHGRKVLDLACGTGDLTMALHQKGYQMTGLDLSRPMLDIAAAKFHPNSIRLICSDMLDFNLGETFESIVCANDSVNYCESLNQYKALFCGVNRHLSMEGIFFFDLHMESRLQEFYEPFEESGRIGMFGYQWIIESEPPMLRHTITLYSQGYPVIETHQQYIFDIKEILSLLSQCGFQWEIIDPKKVNDLYLNEKYLICATKERNV